VQQATIQVEDHLAACGTLAAVENGRNRQGTPLQGSIVVLIKAGSVGAGHGNPALGMDTVMAVENTAPQPSIVAKLDAHVAIELGNCGARPRQCDNEKQPGANGSGHLNAHGTHHIVPVV
jgi:hypothetical protein